MKYNKIINNQENCLEKLRFINNINFTSREIDIMAGLLNARGTSRIASFLAISPRTVANHINNVMAKLGCNSREGIIDFIEKSNKQSLLRRHYSHLMLEAVFKNTLKAFAKPKYKIPLCSLVYWKTEVSNRALFERLKDHLELAGVKTQLEMRSIQPTLYDLKSENNDENYRLYVMPANLNKTEDLFEKLSSDSHQISPNCLFLFIGKTNFEVISRELCGLECIDFTEQANYYFSVFGILKKFLPNDNVEKLIVEFKKQYKLTNESSAIEMSQERSSVALEKGIHFFSRIQNFLKKRQWSFLIVCIAVISVLNIGFFSFKGGKKREFMIVDSVTQQSSPSIRSDLILPSEASFLNRPKLIEKIDRCFKVGKGIQIVALIGIGGAGKTTLARQYASQQQADVIWEINSETALTLLSSFEKLSQVLAKTETEIRVLKEIQGIQNPTERENKIVQFVKNQFNLLNKWILIFDNVEKFSDIQKYFPCNIHEREKGKIILTTRDRNIQNSKHISQTVLVGELSSQEKIMLFTRIMNHENKQPLTQEQINKAKFCLTKIPSLPLDISTAAYYIKTANISLDKYLKRLEEYEDNFVKLEGNVLKDFTDYTKTRYNIITLSIKQVIDLHKDFVDLLLLISLLDSQKIPRIILESYKNEIIVDELMYHLKKYSLISDESPPSPPLDATFSLHRSTQAILLSYLTKILNIKKEQSLLQPVAQILEKQVAETMERANVPLLKLYQRHCEAFLSHTNLISPSMQGFIEAELGRTYLFFGHYVEAKEFLERGYKKLKMNFSPRYSKILTYMGILYRVLGDYERAISFFNKSLSLIQGSSDKTCQTTAMTLAFLGEAYKDNGDYGKALTHLQESFRICKQLGTKDECIPRALAHLGIVYRDIGDYAKACTFLEESHVLSKKNLSDTGMAMTLAFLGDVQREIGNLKKAKILLEQSLEIYKKHFADTHLSIARTRGYLGAVYGELGKYKEAKALLEQAYKIHEKHFGAKHPAPAIFLRNLGRVYCLEGNIKKAEELMKEALTVFTTFKHPLAYISFEDIADLNTKKFFGLNKEKREKNKKYKTLALEQLTQALNIVNTQFPVESKHKIRIQNKINRLML